MSNEKRILVITPNNIAFSVINPGRDVCVHLDLDPAHTGLLIDAVIRMTPAETRRIAKILLQKADEAEAGLPRA
jgi:ethanolamine utilization microcompartment shell protein EutS